MRRVVLFGYFGAGNLGDESILAATLELLRALPDVEPTAVSHDPVATRSLHGVAAVGWARPGALGRALRSAHAVLLGGGGLLQDVTSLRSLLYYTGWAYAAGRRRPVVWWALGVGPLRRPLARRLVQLAGGRAARVSVRDEWSRRLLRDLGVPVHAVVPDPAFLLRPPAPVGDGGPVVVCPRTVPGRPAFAPWLAEELRAIRRASGREIWLLPLQRGEDEGLADGLTRAVPTARRLPTPATPAEALARLAEAAVVVSVRLHGLILAAVSRRPLVAIPYDPKVEVHARMLGQPVVRPGEGLAAATLAQLASVGPDPEPIRRRVAEGFRAVMGPVLEA